MSAPARALQDRTTATATINVSKLRKFQTLNRVFDALGDADLYESEDEQRPSPTAFLAAANALELLPPQDAENVEIEPYSGELSLIWRAGNHKRVKAMFGAERDSYSVYHERMDNGRVVERHLQVNADDTYLADRLSWLHVQN